VYTVKSSGKGLRLVSDYGNAPAFSPAGRTLAYPDIEFDAKGTGEIYLQSMRRPYSEQRLTKHPISRHFRGPGDFEPAWSPDGRLIAFARCDRCDTQREYSEIFTMHRDGTHLKPLTSGRSPAWSTRGRIALIRDGDIYTVNPDGQDA
jgi:Tol biopolymer transport system component